MKTDKVEATQLKYEVLNGSQQTILDLFRITAAFFVVFGHSFSFYHCTVFKDQSCFPSLQNIGVVIFFLLSGFLSAYSLEKNNKDHNYTFLQYFTHKIIRISKEYLPGLIIIVLIDTLSIAINKEHYAYYQAFNIKQFVGNALMLHNMGPKSIMGGIFVPFGSGRPLWTLAVEWWFYMLFGIVFLSLKNKEKVTILRILLFGIFVFMSGDYLINGRGAGLGFVFALGVLSFYGYRILNRKTAMIVFAVSCMLYIVYGVHFKEAYNVYSFIILWLILSSALKTGESSVSCTKRNSVLAFISKSTFMLYLIHYSIIDLIVTADIPWGITFRFVIGIICSFVISVGAYYVFGEKDIIGSVVKVIRKK